MQIATLKNNLVKGEIAKFYIFYGEEQGIMNMYIKQICKKLGLVIKWADNIKSIVKEVNLKSLVPVNYLYLIRDDKDVNTNEKLWKFLKEQLVGSNIVLIQSKLDEKSKFFKEFEYCAVKFDKLTDELALKYAQRLTKLNENNAKTLCRYIKNSYERLCNEADKIETLSKQEGISSDEAFVQLDRDNGIFKEQEFNVFDYVGYICNRKKQLCYKNLLEAKSRQVEPLLISLLMTSIRALLIFNLDGGGKGVCERTGLPGWQVAQCIQNEGNWDSDELESFYLFLQDLEIKLKTGYISADKVIDLILVRLFS